VVKADAHLFKPALAYRMRRSTYPDTPIPPDEPIAQNPPDGAIIDYYLREPASGAVTIEILDAKGKVVRRYSSTDQPEDTQAELEKQLIPLYWIRMPKHLETSAGMHRWVWDLHYARPVSTRYQYPISAVPHDTPKTPQGPRALPGAYTVRLTVNGHSQTASLMVKMDPRVATPAAGIQQMFDLQMRLSSLLTKTSQAAMQAKSLNEQLDKVAEKASGAPAASIEAFKKKLQTLRGSAMPMPDSDEVTLGRVNEACSTLYDEVDRADATPTVPQTEATTKTEKDAAGILQQWDQMKSADLATLNTALRSANLPEIHLEAAPKVSGDDANEE
jgi:hypothetical protein